MKKAAYYLINAITLYRSVAALFLFYLVYAGQMHIFKWLLPVSFFTDLIDGPLARTFKVESKSGSFYDSIGDDLTILAGVIGMLVFKTDFIHEQLLIFLVLFGLFLIQLILALVRYGKISSYHTYSAKAAAILQGSFMILLFLLPDPVYPLFYLAAIFTLADLLEEILLVFLVKEWERNVKGIYWVLKQNSRRKGK